MAGTSPPLDIWTIRIAIPTPPAINPLISPAMAPAPAPLPGARGGLRKTPASTPAQAYRRRLTPELTHTHTPEIGTSRPITVHTKITPVPINPAFNPAFPVITNLHGPFFG
jgi:hypothetical protein